jgi:hypothetical protein
VKGRWIAVAVVIVSVLAGAAIAGAGARARARAATTAGTGAPSQTNCFWSERGASKFGIGANYAFPDSGAVYWAAQITMPAGSYIVFRGRFAHARYQSLNAYDATTRAPVDGLDDIGTEPDRGSVNPYRVGANRDATRRSYTITMYDTTPPAQRARNALYAGVNGQAGQIVIYRIYVPDSFTRSGLTGGVGLPVPTLHLADGAVRSGTAACAALGAKRRRLPLTTLPRGSYQALRDQPGKPRTWPAARTPVFRAYYNTTFSLQCGYQGKCSGHPVRSGGQYSNVDSQYMSALVSRAFRAGPVLVLHGKLPTTPKTGAGARRMGSGQMRYWSMCQNESIYTTIGAGCVYDSQIPVGRGRRYTIVTSLRSQRPANATARCGVAWIPWPAAGDGDGHRDDGLLIVRNMLPSSRFHHAIQDTKVPGDERAVLGPYDPVGHYTTVRAFERRGCRSSTRLGRGPG